MSSDELIYIPDKVRMIKGMSGQAIISIISTNLGPFGANSVIIFGLSFSSRWYTSIFQKLHHFPGNERSGKSIVLYTLFKSKNMFGLSTLPVNRSSECPSG